MKRKENLVSRFKLWKNEGNKQLGKKEKKERMCVCERERERGREREREREKV